MTDDVRDKRFFLRCAAGAAVLPLLTACGGGADDGPGDTAASAPNPQPAPSSFVAGTLAVGTATGPSVDRQFAGLSYEKSSLYRQVFTPDNAALIKLFGLLGPTVLRLGGNSADGMRWVAQGAGAVRDEVAPPDINRLGAFLAACDFRVIYDINLKTETDPAHAAAEVLFVAQALGDRLLLIEIGNEPDGYGWSYDTYLAKWLTFVAAIRARLPTVRIGAPGLAYRTNIVSWSADLVANPQSQLAAVTHHYYRGSGAVKQSIAGLLSQDAGLTNGIVAPLRAAANGLPTRLTEHNSYFSGGAPGISDSNASALWAVQDLFTLASSGMAGANFHGGGNSAYTPIEDAEGAVTAVRPLFYGLVMFAQAGPGALLATTLQSSGVDAAAYALRAAGGDLRVMVVNKDAAATLQLTLTVAGFTPRSADLLLLSLPSLDGLSGATVQGAAIGVDGSFQPAAPYTLQTQQDGSVRGFVGPASIGLFRLNA